MDDVVKYINKAKGLFSSDIDRSKSDSVVNLIAALRLPVCNEVIKLFYKYHHCLKHTNNNFITTLRTSEQLY